MRLTKVRSLVLVVGLVGVAAYVGFLAGARRLRVELGDFRPAVVVNQAPPSARGAKELDFSLFWSVWDRLGQLYVDKAALDAQKMLEGAISGMVAAVGDPYTVFLTAQQNQEAKQDLGGAFEGVGIQLGFKDKRLAVIAPLPGTPAAKAGVKAGDFILHIRDQDRQTDQDTEGLTIPEAVTLIRGPAGTVVELTLSRPDHQEPIKVKLTRETILVKSASVEFLDHQGKKVAWLKLTRFGDRTHQEWGEAISEIRNQKSEPRGIVLDLRNNPGGYLEEAVYLAGEFLPAGKLVVTQAFGDTTRTSSRVGRNGRLLAVPLVVIVNQGSASASEILAGSLQAHRRAKIVGESTFGKGSVQQPEDFPPSGAGLHVTVAKWLLPTGKSIDKAGIKPDVEVKMTNGDDGVESDVQLQKAIEQL